MACVLEKWKQGFTVEWKIRARARPQQLSYSPFPWNLWVSKYFIKRIASTVHRPNELLKTPTIDTGRLIAKPLQRSLEQNCHAETAQNEIAMKIDSFHFSPLAFLLPWIQPHRIPQSISNGYRNLHFLHFLQKTTTNKIRRTAIRIHSLVEIGLVSASSAQQSASKRVSTADVGVVCIVYWFPCNRLRTRFLRCNVHLFRCMETYCSRRDTR